MPRKLISRGCMIFNCDRRHGNFTITYAGTGRDYAY